MKAETVSTEGTLSLRLLVPVAMSFGLFLAGCGYTRQARDDVQPKAYPAMKLAQTLNPDAGKNRKVVSGLDGQAAGYVSGAYAKSFESTKARQAADESFGGTKTK